MARIETYNIAFPVVLGDKLIGTDVTTNETKNFTVGDIINLAGSGTNTEYNLTTSQDVLNVNINLNDTAGGLTKVTLVPSGSIALTDLGSNRIRIDSQNITYGISSAQDLNDVDIKLTDSNGTIDTVTLVKGANITLSDNGSNQITIAAVDNDTTYVLGAVQPANTLDISITLSGSDGSNNVVYMEAGPNIRLTDKGSSKFEIESATEIAGLVDTAIASPANNELLVFDFLTQEWVNGSIALNNLSNTNIAAQPVNNQLLVFDSTTQQWINGNIRLNDLSDTTISQPANGQILSYDATTSKWVNTAVPASAPEKLIQTVDAAWAASNPITPNNKIDFVFNNVTNNFNTGSVHLHQFNFASQNNGWESAFVEQVKISMNIFGQANNPGDELILTVTESFGLGTPVPIREARFVFNSIGEFVVTWFFHIETQLGYVYEFQASAPGTNVGNINIKAISEVESEVLR